MSVRARRTAQAHVVATLVPGLCSCLECHCVVIADYERYQFAGEWIEVLVYFDLTDGELRIARDFWPDDLPRQQFGPFNGAVHLCMAVGVSAKGGP